MRQPPPGQSSRHGWWEGRVREGRLAEETPEDAVCALLGAWGHAWGIDMMVGKPLYFYVQRSSALLGFSFHPAESSCHPLQ